MRYELKEYQREALDRLGEYARRCVAFGRARAERPEASAFTDMTGRPYHAPPGFGGVPYVCVRLPTGGGKTILAAHAVGVLGRSLLGTDNPTCLWVVPTKTILDQTLHALRMIGHPYREALREEVGGEPEVLTLEEALSLSKSVLVSAPVVIVTTIQSYRVRDERTGEEANRRVYRDDGYLTAMFEDLPPETRDGLAKDENGLVQLSLANALTLRRPIVVMDEAHNARTRVSFDSLSRFGPSMVLELTATPQQEHDPTRERYASNVLHAVSALQLCREGMIKLPIELESRGDWLEVLAATKQRRDELETLADRHAETGGPFIRPIALIQAQPHSRTRETHAPEAVKRAMVDRLGVPEEEVRICTGAVDEIKGENLMSADSRVRYIVTVDKLREGWDCPFAYVLGSIGNAATPTAVEQLLGRILRMYQANPTRVPALDRAYAFVLSQNVIETARQLRDRMIETCGFDAHSAEDALHVHDARPQPGLPLGSVAVSAPPAPEVLARFAGRVAFDAEESTLRITGDLTRREAEELAKSAATPEDARAIGEHWRQTRGVGVAARAPGEYAAPFRVPQLAYTEDGRRYLFEPVELETFAWDLDACAAALSEEEFPSEVRVGSRAVIETDESGGLFSRAGGEVRLRQLELIGEGEDWTRVELVAWLDRELHRGGALAGVTPAECQAWLARVASGLIDDRGVSLPMIVRRRHELAEVLRARMAAHGRRQARRAYERLIAERPEAVETTPDMAMEVGEESYAPYDEYTGGYRFSKHAFERIGDMNGEEAECAARIDAHPSVRRWLRNLDRESQCGFWLPLSPGRFFPDFLVELVDGRLGLVEYKGGDRARNPDELHKKAVGELWQGRSGGRCVFVWVADGDWHALDRGLAAADPA